MARTLILVAIAVITALAAAATVIAAPTGTPYKTTVFDPPFRLELPKGWVVAERAPDVAQIYRPCASCLHEGEENGEITFDMALAKLTAAKAIALLHRASGIRATPVQTVTYGRLRGPGFTARRTGDMIEFPRSGYRSDPTGAPIKVFVVRAAEKTVTVFIDPHERPPAKAPAFMQDAAAILRALRFAS
jgi:hypothetical protein